MKKMLFITLPLLLTGCLSPKPSRQPAFYQLREAADLPRAEADFPLPFLIIGPVDLSPYLDQPRFALRLTENEIQYQEYQRWAEPLAQNIASVLSANLRHYFQTADIGPHAPRLVLNKEQPRVLLLINRLDVDQDNQAMLDLQWALTPPPSGGKPAVHQGTYLTRAASDSPADRVAALNQLLTECSLDIAKTIEGER